MQIIYKLVGTRDCNVAYADGLVLLSKEGTALQGMIDRLIVAGRHHGMDITVTECKVLRISRQATPVQIIIDQKQLGNVEYFM